MSKARFEFVQQLRSAGKQNRHFPQLCKHLETECACGMKCASASRKLV